MDIGTTLGEALDPKANAQKLTTRSWRRCCELRAEAHDLTARTYELDLAATEADPYIADAQRAEAIEHLHRMIAAYRQHAADYRRMAIEATP